MTILSDRSFNLEKAAEIAYLLLSKAGETGDKITKSRFMGLMYLAERACYRKYGYPLTGDVLRATQQQPVLAKTMALIENTGKPNNDQTPWDRVVHVVREHNREYLSLATPGYFNSENDLQEVSDADIDLVDEIFNQFGTLHDVELEMYFRVSNNCTEWEPTEGSETHDIPLENLLQGLGYSTAETEHVIKNIKDHEAIDAIFAGE